MARKFGFRVVLWFALGCGVVVTSAQAGFVYVLNDNDSGNQIYGFSVNESTGALTLLAGFPVATGGNGGGSVSFSSEDLTIDSVNQRLYAINDGSDTVSAYSIDPATGALAVLPYSPITLGPGTWVTIAVHPSGSPLVVGCITAQVRSYVLTSTRATEAAGSPYSTVANPFSSVFSRNGSFYYTGGNSGSAFAGFNVNTATGVLTVLAGSPFESGGNFPVAYATDSQSRFFTANASSNALRAFVTASGVPSAVAGNPFASGLTDPIDGVLHPNEQFYFVADRSGNQVGSYQIGGSGASTTLTAVAGSPFAAGGVSTHAVVTNQAGSFLFAANGGSRNLTTYAVNSTTGVLTNASVQPVNLLGAAGRLKGIAYLPTSGITPTPSPTAAPPARSLNISARSRVQTGDNVMIGGFIVTGNASKKVIVRAIGPSLQRYGLTGVLADPVLELHGPDGSVIAFNDNWRENPDQALQIQESGIPPQDDHESAIVATLPPAGYTAIVKGKSNGTGVGLVEVYELDQRGDSKLANISARAFVETGNDVLIGGFVLGGANGSPKMIIRAIGPSLAQLGVSNPLADPTLELRDGNGMLLAFNNNWKDNPDQAAQVMAAGAQPRNDLEAAIAATLPPGAYTAIVAGRDRGTGVGLVEVYNLQ
jgi:6-phosphogluconolactonase (cycloisomerase 2 family)